jgi:hypothetical protein
MARVAARFVGVEPRRRVRAFLTGLLVGCRGRTAGRSPSMLEMPARTGCSICLADAVWDADAALVRLSEQRLARRRDR